MRRTLAVTIVAAIISGLLCLGLWLAHLAHVRDSAPARERLA